jgi:Flp pilus assembly pilin Flp
MSRRLHRLWRDRSGSVMVEFALLGPLMLGVLIGVFQIGIGMWSYNSLRSISGDVARYAVVNYQTDNDLSTTQLEAYAEGVATNPPYGLLASELDIEIDDAEDQRIAGAKELTISIAYEIPSILTLFGFESPTINFSRPIFLIED